MFEQENKVAVPNSSHKESSDQNINHILQVNYYCLLEILKYFSMIELCDISESCKRFQEVARDEFKRRGKFYAIPKYGVKFTDHARILRNFGDLIDEASLVNFMDLGEYLGRMDSSEMERAFNWFERYCAKTLQKLTIIDRDAFTLPSSAVRLMAKMKTIKLHSSISFQNARTALRCCKELVNLSMTLYDGPFHLADFHFPHLRTLDHRVNVNSLDYTNQFRQMENFFKNHPKLIELKTEFHSDWDFRYTIDISFIRHLVDLEKLELTIRGADVIGTESLANVKKLKDFMYDQSRNVRTDVAMLDNLASVDLVKLELGFSEIDHLIASIERFKKLTQLSITQDMLPILDTFDTNISNLSQLRNSQLTELNLICNELLEPASIVDVVCNLTELKEMKLWCRVELTEAICKKIAVICSRQRRKIKIILCEEALEDMNFDFVFMKKFNEEHELFIEIK